MNNQDMPANAVLDDRGMPFNELPSELCTTGETKREKAFWQVYSAIISNSKASGSWGGIAEIAIAATDEGFKALDAKD